MEGWLAEHGGAEDEWWKAEPSLVVRCQNGDEIVFQKLLAGHPNLFRRLLWKIIFGAEFTKGRKS